MLCWERALARKIDWERQTLSRKARIGLSVKDEAEFMQNDAAARWLARREQVLAKPNKPATPLLKQKPSTRTKSARPSAASFEALDPQDPHHQLADVDMSRPPW